MGHLSRLILPLSRNPLLHRYTALLQIKSPLGYVSSCAYTRESTTEGRYQYLRYTALVTCAAVGTWGVYHYLRDEQKTVHLEPTTETAGDFRPDLPTFTMEEVCKHKSKQTKVWVTYHEGVYDITQFVDGHPGGNIILLAAGGSLEPFWKLYALHNDPVILSILEEFRIGNISSENTKKCKESTLNEGNPFAAEPRRHPALQVISSEPYNAEPPLNLLVHDIITPSEIFYVRNHLPVPEIDPQTYQLQVTGTGICPMRLSLDQLKNHFPKYTVIATIQCAGNRRNEMSRVKPVKGLSWGASAIGNAVWTGAKLRDVLLAAGLKPENKRVGHVQFEGLDRDISNVPYGASIPIMKAMDPWGDVLLAYEMNGAPLSRDHGYPVRVIVPGVVGARNVKWLGRIVISEEESSSHWQQNDYKGFSPSIDWHNVDFSTAEAIQELPVVSAICEPSEGQIVNCTNEKIVVKGYAWTGGGHRIIRVDVTGDFGKTWHVAKLTQEHKARDYRNHWSWTLWQAEIPIPEDINKVELWARAVDSSYNVQPEHVEYIWNLRGVLNNAFHKVKVRIQRNVH